MSSFASRFITALLGLAVIVLFWPSWLPIGFPQAWWVQELTRPEPLPQPSRELFTKPSVSSAEAPAAVPSWPAEPAPVAAPVPAPTPEATPQPTQAAQPAEAPKKAHAIPTPTAELNAAPEDKEEVVADATPTAAIDKSDEIKIAPKEEPKLTYHVVVRDGGTLEADGVVIRLGGIHARDADATCRDKNGRSWRCGAQARVALTRLIRGRAVRCDPPATGAQKQITARCTVGQTDLATWMVTQGWAVPNKETEAKLAKAVQAARNKRLGLWR
ncbi:MAG: thermonuclease family protein [Hyphomicrobiales bacterium]